jgi:hypothetical protein
MKRINWDTPFYVRTKDGDTFHTPDLESLLTQFVSDQGYRITMRMEDGTEVIIRRNEDADLNPEWMPDSEQHYGATVTIRRRR